MDCCRTGSESSGSGCRICAVNMNVNENVSWPGSSSGSHLGGRNGSSTTNFKYFHFRHLMKN